MTPDEDADCVANDADNCPGIANSAQEDGDGDGVGDVCDPRPVTAGDRIVTFDGFDDPVAAQQTWHDMEQQDMWLFEPGSVRRTEMLDSFSALEITEPVTLDAFAIEMGILVDDFTASVTVKRQFQILIDHPLGDTSSGHHCEARLRISQPAGTVDALLQEDSGTANGQFIDAPTIGSVVVIQLARRADSEVRCTLHVNGVPSSLGKLSRPPAAVWPRTGRISLYINYVSLSLLWTTLYAQ